MPSRLPVTLSPISGVTAYLPNSMLLAFLSASRTARHLLKL